MSLTGRLARRAAPWALAATLAGCGGGLWIGIGGDGWSLYPPSVSLATAASTVASGGTLYVVAAAAGENGIAEVAFYRRDGGAWTLLGRDYATPYDWLVPVPADGRSVLEVFARATDRAGLQADSQVLQVPVAP